jgi:enoyl-CoA hydratase/carnithine racemase
VTARLPWDHLDVGLEDGFLLREYRKAMSDRLSPPCGKVAGTFIHHTNLDDALADSRKLVCYDCGVGCDLTAMRDVGTSSQFMDYMNRWRRLNEVVENHAKPVIAAIEGWCLTGGFELALACDLRVGAVGSQYGITSAKIGTVPGAGGTQRLPRIVGVANALDILFSADFIDAERAKEIGILNRLVPKGAALAKAREMVATYATRAPLSLRYAKRAVHAGMQMPLSDAIKFEAFVVSTIYQTEEKDEGVRAFLEKRPPQFKGR